MLTIKELYNNAIDRLTNNKRKLIDSGSYDDAALVQKQIDVYDRKLKELTNETNTTR